MPKNIDAVSGKKLLILDGSKKSIEIIDQARKMGVHTVVTDYNSPDESPAKYAANEYFSVSTSNVEAVASLIHSEGITGVLPGFSDRWLPTYADICERAGLPSYATADQLRLFTDKKRYKQLLSKHGIPTIQGFTREEAESGAVPDNCYPLLVKPADGSGSRGITICSNAEELHFGIKAALDYSWTSELIIERFLPGQEATVYWLIRDGEYFVTMLANRHMVNVPGTPARLPYAYTSPSYLMPGYLSDIAPRVRAMLAEAGILNGMMFMQGLIQDDVFHTYDIGYRVTPTQEYRILEDLSGFNPLGMLIRFALTGSMGDENLAETAPAGLRGYGYNVSTLAAPGEIGSFVGLDDVRSLPGVLAATTSLREGDVLPAGALGQLSQVVVRTIGTAQSKGELRSRVQEVAAMIDVLGTNGESLLVKSPDIANLSDLILETEQEEVEPTCVS